MSDIAITYRDWLAMTGDSMPPWMASAPTHIMRSWEGKVYAVLVSAEEIRKATESIAQPLEPKD